MKKLINICSSSKFLFFFSFIQFFIINPQFVTLYSQLVQQEWIRYYPDSNSKFTTFPQDMVLDDSGYVYITGLSLTNTWEAFCTMKYSPAGNLIWVSNYYGISIGGREAKAIVLDKNSNVFVTGSSYQNSTFVDFCTIKYNSSGVEQWINYYDGLIHGEDEGEVIAADNANNIYVSGFSEISTGHYVFTTIKYSNDGMQLWVRNNWSPAGHVYCIKTDDSCNVYIVGTATDSTIMKYDSSGKVMWANSYSGFNGRAIVIDSSHNSYVTGYVLGGYTFSDFLALKYSSVGSKIWERRYNVDSTTQGSSNGARKIVLDNLSNIYISGYAGNTYSGIINFCTLKYTNSGDFIWVNKDTIQSSGTISMDIDKNNNFYITGNYFINNFINSIIVRKYNSSGVSEWTENYNDSNAAAISVKVDDNNNVYITGWKGGNANDDKLYLLKYTQPIGVKQISSETSKTFVLFQNYPNPFNPKTEIQYQIPFVSNVELVIYDILGRKITTLVNEKQKEGVYKINWDADNFASGIYFYKINSRDFNDVKKMVLIK
jgi:hypothetical protein